MKKKTSVGDEIGVWRILEKDSRPAHWKAECTKCGNIKIKRKNEFCKYTCTCQGYEKRKQNNLEKYGVSSPQKLPEIQKKIEATMKERYGCSRPLQSSIFKEKTRRTNLKRHGVENPMQSQTIRDKAVSTNIERYGVPYPSQNREIKAKQRAFVLSDGTIYSDLYKEHNIPATTAQQTLIRYGEDVAIEFCKNYTGRKIYSTEVAFIQLMKSVFENIEKYDKPPQEFKINRRPDFRLELNDKILYINIDGLATHSTFNTRHAEDYKYHLNLQQDFTTNNQTIFQFREDELRDNSEIIKSIILNYFNIHQEKHNARQLTTKLLTSTDAEEFFKNNHLMGAYRSSQTYGLYTKDNKLVSCMSVRLNKKDNSLEIARFASRINISVRGGFSKLLKHVERTHRPSKIISFCDMRYSTGKSYEKCDFTKISTTLGWSWTDKYRTYNRLRCRANMDDRKLSEKEHAKELNWYRIHDAGQVKYVKSL